MLTYILSGSNTYTIRTQPTGSSNDFTMSLQDMTTLVNSTASLSNVTFQPYESILAFTASIDGTITGEEYRAVVYNGTSSIWHGSIQVYASQSWKDEGKSNYQNQIPLDDAFVSNVSENKYIIMT
jgi:hypothetical protein